MAQMALADPKYLAGTVTIIFPYIMLYLNFTSLSLIVLSPGCQASIFLSFPESLYNHLL